MMKKLCQLILEKHRLPADKISKIGAGAASVIYLAKGKKSFAIKIKLKQVAGLDNEYSVLRLIEKYNLSPKVIAHGQINDKHYLIEEFIPGKRLPWRGVRVKQIEAAARFFKKLHSIKLNKHLMQLKLGKNLPLERLEYTKASAKNYTALEPLVKVAEDKIKTIIVKNEIVFRHTDPNPHNLIYNKGKIKAIDFEEAKLGHWAIDVADFVIKANLNESQKNLFLKTYGCKDRDLVEAFIIVGWLSLCGWSIDQLKQAELGQIDKRLAIDVKREQKALERRIKHISNIIGGDG